MASVIKQWKKFSTLLSDIDSSTNDKQHFYSVISDWLTSNRNLFSDQVWGCYHLGYFASLDPSQYRVGSAEDSVSVSIEVLIRAEPSSLSTMAMFIRDTLWDMVAYKTRVRCPNCEDDDLRALIEPDSQEIVLSCDLCLWSQLPSGKKWSGPKTLIPANKTQLSGL